MDIWRLLLIVRYSNFSASGRAQNTLIRRRTTASSATDKRSLLIPIRSYRRTSMHLTACGSLTRIPLWDRNPLNLCLKQIESGFFLLSNSRPILPQYQHCWPSSWASWTRHKSPLQKESFAVGFPTTYSTSTNTIWTDSRDVLLCIVGPKDE